MPMKTKTIIIIVGFVLLLIIIGYFTFPLVLVLFKSMIGMIALVLIGLGIFIGTLIPKKRRNE